MGPVLAWAGARLAEPSTWAGIAYLIGSASFIPHNQDLATQIPMWGSMVAGALAAILPEAKKS